MRILQNYVGGKWTDSSSGRRRQSFNPARRDEIICEAQDSTSTDAERALHSAHEAFPAWSRNPMPKRAALLQEFLRNLGTREDEFAQAITRENGKTLRESRTEFLAALKEAEFQVGQGRRAAGAIR